VSARTPSLDLNVAAGVDTNATNEKDEVSLTPVDTSQAAVISSANDNYDLFFKDVNIISVSMII
jgi:hypothetical protein